MPKYSCNHNQKGFSLVELMVALTLGLLLVAGVTTLSYNANQTYRATNSAGQQIENGRFAMEILREDLQHAGFFGQIGPSNTIWTMPGALPVACNVKHDVAASPLLDNLANSFTIAVTGFNNQAAAPADYTCISDIMPNTDILIIRRVDTNTISLAGLADNSTWGNAYIQSGIDTSGALGYVVGICNSGTNCVGRSGLNDGLPPSSVSGEPSVVFNLQKMDGTTADLRRYRVHIYYVRRYSSSSSENPQIPTLMRVELTNSGVAPSMRGQPLIEGIENMQIQYGLDDGTAPGNANDGAPDRYVDLPDDVMAWSNVVAVKLNLLVRTLEPDFSYTDTKTYNLGDLGGGDNIVSPGGGYKRRVFTSLVKLINVGTRRECQATVWGPECE